VHGGQIVRDYDDISKILAQDFVSRNAVFDKDANHLTIYIDEPIGMGYYGPVELRNDLSFGNPDSTVDVEIHSTGGSLMDGVRMYQMLLEHKGEVRTLASTAASAAALIFLAGDVRKMRAESTLMFHDCSITATGSIDELQKIVDDMKILNEQQYSMQEKHSNLSLEEIIEMNKREDILTADKALEFGFATEIIDNTDDDVDRNLASMEALQNISRLAGLTTGGKTCQK